ncbi:MAG: hypothetical protein ACXWXZ_03980 [Candidatus Binatia bacterium]
MRKTLTYTVTDEGRDKGKAFQITEMGASRAQRWARRTFSGMIRAGFEVPQEIVDMGIAGLFSMGFKSFFSIDDDRQDQLFNELMTCVRIIPDPAKPNVIRDLIEEDIEEYVTRFKLEWEVINLHVDFLAIAAPSTTDPNAAAMMD